jgi:hypothetical protein
MDSSDDGNTPKKKGGRPRGLPKTGGRVKGVPPKVPQSLREVLREVLGLENLVIRKRLQRWFETGDAGGLDHGAGLGSATFRHILLMGNGQPKHTMETGDKRRESLIFLSKPPEGLHTPWCWANDASRKSNALIVHEGPCRVEKEPDAITAGPAAIKALEASRPPAVVIDTKAGDQDKDSEPLELVEPPPEPPEPFNPGIRERDRGR